MDVTQLPFNCLIGLMPARADSGFLVTIPEGPQYLNHLGTVHASVLLAVAEAGSGAFLLNQLGDTDGVLPVVRRVAAKFLRPASGSVSARAAVASEKVTHWVSELASRGRVLAAVPVEVVDALGVVALSATVEWFIARTNP